MKHIGIDARLTHYRVGGISTYVRRLVHALEALDRAEHAGRERFTVLQSRRMKSRLASRFSTAKVWTPAHHRLERYALSAELLRFNFDVLHSPDFIPPQCGARRHIITIHDLTFLHEPEHKDVASRRYYNDQIDYAVRHADHILAVSNSTRQDLITLLNVPPERITVQPNGVDERFRPMPDELLEQMRADAGLPNGYVLFVGTLEPRKNVMGLLDAYAALPADLRHEHPLLLVGHPGWLFDDIFARIEALRQHGMDIIHRQDIDDTRLPAVYNLASVLVLPSFYEGFGLPPLEAMACGTPVVTSDRAALPEVVGDAGAMIHPEDTDAITAALERALVDKAWRAAAREKGLLRAQTFTWSRSAEIALSIYRAVI